MVRKRYCYQVSLKIHFQWCAAAAYTAAVHAHVAVAAVAAGLLLVQKNQVVVQVKDTESVAPSSHLNCPSYYAYL